MVTADLTEADKQRIRANNLQRAYATDAREIGAPPAVGNPERRAKASKSLRVWLETYFAEAFYYPFGEDHYAFINDVEAVIREGGQYVVLMPRASGKTTVLQRAVLYATMTGASPFGMIVGADQVAADRLMGGMKTLLQSCQPLIEDFPEVCHPIGMLEDIGHRCRGQSCNGQPTRIQWAKNEIRFAQTEYTRKAGNSGAGIKTAGLEGGGIRGSVITLENGQQIRPSVVLVDDPQTRRSANSPTHVDTRESLLNADILRMAGPGRSMSCLVSATAIYPDDVTARLTDRERNPHWKSRVVPMIKQWPKNMKLWEEWDGLRRQEAYGEKDAGTANKFFSVNQELLCESFEVYWEHRIEPGRVSAYDSAMQFFFDNPRSFNSEFQNRPDAKDLSDFVALDTAMITKKTSKFARGEVPPDVEKIVCHVDVQLRMLFYTVCGITPGFGVYVIDYGTWPRHNQSYFNYATTRVSLQRQYKGETDETCIRLGVQSLLEHLNNQTYTRTDEGELHIDLGLVDVRYKGQDVEHGMMATRLRNWRPMYGVGIRAANMPLNLRTQMKGTKGDHWLIQKPNERKFRSVFADVNHWKSQAYSALKLPTSHPESISLFEAPASMHQMFADHCVAEEGVRTEAMSRTVEEWQLKGGRDNHYWDNLVGCMVAASILGVRKKGNDVTRYVRKSRPKVRIQA